MNPVEEGEELDPVLNFRPDDESTCPKCTYAGIKTVWHPCVVAGQLPPTSCELAELEYPAGVLSIGEHLCRRCTRCTYGWMERTADS